CAARIALPETQQAKQQPRGCHEIKGPAPAEMSADQPANHIAERAPNWNRRAKNRHDATPRFNREEIGQNRWRRGAVTAFANSNKDPSSEQYSERRGQTRRAAGQTPQNDSRCNDDPERETVGKETENRRTDHVSHKKGVTEQTGLGHGVYVASGEKSRANIRFE